MSDLFRFVGGSKVNCSDGHCGTLGRLIVEPSTKTLTHLAVEGQGLRGAGRLIPVDCVTQIDDAIHLTCSKAEFESFDAAEQSMVVATPNVPRGGGLPFAYLTLDQVPAGELEMNSEENIQATNGKIGRLEGLQVAADDHHITDLLLEVGHFSNKKTVAIPINMVTSIDGNGITLSLSKTEVTDFQ